MVRHGHDHPVECLGKRGVDVVVGRSRVRILPLAEPFGVDTGMNVLQIGDDTIYSFTWDLVHRSGNANAGHVFIRLLAKHGIEFTKRETLGQICAVHGCNAALQIILYIKAVVSLQGKFDIVGIIASDPLDRESLTVSIALTLERTDTLAGSGGAPTRLEHW